MAPAKTRNPFAITPVIQTIIVVACFFPSNAISQDLLLNGDFEEENICIEYKVNCAPEAWLTNDDVFNNYYKNVRGAYSGRHYMSVEAGNTSKPFKRTFIRSHLLCGLRKGNHYLLSFAVRSSPDLLDSIGVYFSAHDFLFDKRALQSVTPAYFLVNAIVTPRKDSSWQTVQFNYTATGDEAFLTVGNFSKRDIKSKPNSSMGKSLFVFIDAISLVPSNINEKPCEDWATRMVDIYDQDERHEFLRRKIRAGRGYDPLPLVLVPNAIIRTDTLVLQEVLFKSGQADLARESYALLDEFSRKIEGWKVDSVVVEGHTDNRGSEEMNNQLSSARVQTVLNYFATRSFVRPNRVFARAWGESRPVADNNTAHGRQRNRRVIVILYLRG